MMTIAVGEYTYICTHPPTHTHTHIPPYNLYYINNTLACAHTIMRQRRRRDFER